MRLFVAIPAEDSFLDRIRPFLKQWKKEWKEVKWVPETQLHLTLKFLGETKDHEPVCEALSALAVSPFEARLSPEPLFWGRGAFASVIALELEDPVLPFLSQEIQKALLPCGFETERRPFKPHLTVGRIKFPVTKKEAREHLIKPLPQENILYPCRSITLFESRLTPEGPRYISRKEFPLKGTRG